ncbi:hypothetical protein [Curtobacterium ammoniigenes]|uniref:hypothetical protein n=1 Tax=Curtobacterium ammoniigenes TaxID=395387 RepID=UPI0008343595|nr:hypothetical protein [Curtobacterium ammoniigenes]
MITVVLGLCGAIIYGFADFLGGVASRQLRPVAVTAMTATIGILPLIVGLALFGGRFSPATVVFGLIGGVSGGIGILLLYAALAVGPMSVLSPITAVFSALVPAVVGLARGSALPPLSIGALIAGIISVVLVAAVPDRSGARLTVRGILAAVIAGCGFGGLVLAYDATPADAGVAPLVVARILEAVLLSLAAVASLSRTGRRQRRRQRAPFVASAALRSRLGWRFWLVVVACGVCDASANVFIQSALHSSGDPSTLPVVSVLNALYPIGTIALACVALRERLTTIQASGIALAVASSAVLALH